MAVSIHGNNGVVTTNGTAAAPSLAAPDTDTGLYFDTNTIKATTDGTERLQIKADGKIEVPTTGKLSLGMSSPVAQFTVGTANGSKVIEIQGIDGVIRGYNRNSSAWSAIDFEASSYTFDTAGTLRMTLTGDGPHLLLGGNSDVNEITESSAHAGMVIGGTGFGNGGLAIINSTSGTGRIYFGDAVTNGAGRNRGQVNYYHNGDYMMFATAGSERLRITSGGNVDINGTPPWSVAGGDYRNLSISGQVANSGGFLWLGNGTATTNGDFDLGRINVCNGANIVAQITGTTDTSANDDGRLDFYTRKTGESSPDLRLRITSAGRVGINENNPEGLLHIDGVSNDPYIYLQRSGAGDAALDIGGIFWKNDTKLSALIKCRTIDRDDAELIFETMYQNSRTEKLRIKNDGKLMTQQAGFMYTSSSAGSLTLAGGNTNLGGKIVLTGGNGDGDIKFYAQKSTATPSQRMVIKDDGKIGINDTTPSRIMSINGSINLASGSRIESYSSGGNLIIQGGSTYPGGHIQMYGGSGSDMITFNTSGTGTSSVERLRINASGRIDIKGDGGNDGFTLSNAYGQAGLFGGMYYNGSSWVRNATSGRKGAGVVAYTGGHIAILTAPENSGSTATMSEKAKFENDGAFRVSNPDQSNDSAINVYKSAGDNANKAIIRVGYDEGNSFKVYRTRADSTYYMEAGQSNAAISVRMNDGGTIGEKARIDAAGYVHMHKNGFCKMFLNSTGTQTIPQGPFEFTMANGTYNSFNVGGHYKTSGTDAWKFVCPVAGYYHFHFQSISQQNITNAWMAIRRNGSYVNRTHWTQGGNWDQQIMQTVISANAGDKVDFYNHQSCSFYGQEWTWMTIMKIA